MRKQYFYKKKMKNEEQKIPLTFVSANRHSDSGFQLKDVSIIFLM